MKLRMIDVSNEEEGILMNATRTSLSSQLPATSSLPAPSPFLCSLIGALILLGLAAAAQGAPFAYITNWFSNSNTVSVLDTATNTVIATIPTPWGMDDSPGMAVHPAGTFVYVANAGSDTVSVLDTATNTVVATVPVGGHPIAYGQFVGPELPGVSLTLNQASFHGGETMILGATTYAGATPREVDAYLGVRLPDGTSLFMQADGSFTTDSRPIVSNWPVGPLSGEIFRYTFGGGEVSGSYGWLSYYTEPGTSNIIGIISQAAFTFIP